MTWSNTHSVVIRGIGRYLPEKMVSNEDLSKIVDTSDERIRTRTGICSRHIAEFEEKNSDLCTEAASLAIKNAGLSPSDIDLLIIATITPDMPLPSTAALVQAKLGLRTIPAFDISAACSGFLYAIDIATSMMLRSPSYKNVLVIGGEKLSSYVDWTDRSTCVLFGDGAGAVVFSKTETQGIGVIDTIIGADGTNADMLCVKAGGSSLPATKETIENKQHFVSMNGKEVFKHAVRVMEKVAREILEKHKIPLTEINCFISHQANQRIIDSLSEHLGLNGEKVFVNLNKVGNTSAASIPLALSDAIEQGKIKTGDWVLLVAFGAGLTWGSTLIKWH